jgi:pimeloyl-ACP methyl ester carboxylesterase
VTRALPRLEPLRYARTGTLEVAYYEAGPSDGDVTLLLHGFPYDIHSYTEVIPLLAETGRRVIVPYLRGHGPTRFLDPAAPRSGQQAAIGTDVVDLMDALGIPRAILAGYDWGGRAACVAAALWPERCAGLVTVGSYLIQNIATAMTPVPADLEAGFWYFYYFLTERGRADLTANRREIARVIWARNSPAWHFDDATLERTAVAFGNPDYVEVVLHSYRHRLGAAPSCQPYDQAEQLLAAAATHHRPGDHPGRPGRRQLPGLGRQPVSTPLHRPPRASPGAGGRAQPAPGSPRPVRPRGPGTGGTSMTAATAHPTKGTRK